MPRATSRTTKAAKPRTVKKKEKDAHFLIAIKEKIVSGIKAIWAKDMLKFPIIVLALMIFTSVLMMLMEKDSGMYTGDIDKTLFGRFVSSMYFGIVSLSTSGYGDYTPRTILGRIYCIFFLSAGVILFSMLTATIASVLVEQKLREGRGMGDLSHMKNHFIICGWKKDMENVLNSMMANNDEFTCKDIVVIANVDPDKAEIIKQQNPCLREMSFLRGDYFNEVMLKKANVETAKQVFILADESVEGATISEVDSWTVMAAMSINALTRNVRICAELLDTKYERYLQNAHVDEIIYSSDYGRLMLANATASTGLPQIINHLLDIKTSVSIATRPFPFEYVGKTYAELRRYCNEHYKASIIGVLENVGNHWMHKQEAIREAQKTPDISQLVQNLQKVKTMVSNTPNLVPADDYVIPKNTLAILLEKAEN